MQFLDILNFDFLPNLALDCYIPSFDYCTKVVFTCVMPICVLAVMLSVGAMHRRMKGPDVWKAYIYAMLMFTFFIFLNCSTTLFHFLKCDPFPDLDDRFLMKDYRLSCKSTRYTNHQIFVILMILVPVWLCCSRTNLFFLNAFVCLVGCVGVSPCFVACFVSCDSLRCLP